VPLVAAPVPRILIPEVLTPVSGYPAVLGTGTGLGCLYIFCVSFFIITPYVIVTVTVPVLPVATKSFGVNTSSKLRDPPTGLQPHCQGLVNPRIPCCLRISNWVHPLQVLRVVFLPTHTTNLQARRFCPDDYFFQVRALKPKPAPITLRNCVLTRSKFLCCHKGLPYRHVARHKGERSLFSVFRSRQLPRLIVLLF
jgi:hypothetical protein